MPRLIAQGPEGQAVVTLDPSGGRAVLLGRSPDPRAMPTPCTEGRVLEPVTIGGPSVSANHAAVWCDETSVYMRDLGSRNGTWLLLPKYQTVSVNGQVVVLHLAQAVGAVAAGDEPAPPVWSTRGEYAAAIAASIERWLQVHGIVVTTAVVAEPSLEGGPPTRVPLVTGESLDIIPRATTDGTWSRLLEHLWRWTARQNAIYETEEDTKSEGMILASSSIRAVHREVVDAAKGGTPTLLLTGPSGSGKEMLAEVFHRNSGRSGAFVAINCAMLSRELLRSELFGAEAGSFTGATRRIVGAVERAQGGTLFLDEIGEISNEVQAMLLRFLDRREYEHVGQYGRVQRADVRLVAATNRDLREAARTGAFRADLWFRLSVYEIEVPPLHRRWEDVAVYLQSVRTEDGRRSILDALSPGALELLRAHPWEGNFRELRGFAERLSRRALPDAIDAATCRRALERGALRLPSSPPRPSDSEPTDWTSLVSRAVQAFVEDRGRPPSSWDDQKEWNEKYLKPLLFFHLSGVATHPPPADDDALRSLAAKLASRVQADRGTAVKQLERYFERFRG